MNLIIDIGNTNSKYAIFEAHTLIKTGYLNEILSELSHFHIKYAIIVASGNIPPSLIDTLNNRRIRYINFTTNSKIPIDNCYETPEKLGLDRLAGAIGGSLQFPKQNVLVVDAGTCITYDFVNSMNQYLGGSISPGIALRFNAMHDFTAKLPLVKLDNEVELVGKNTDMCLKSGVYFGVLLEIDGIIDAYKLKFPNLKVVLTGGDTDFLESKLKNEIFADKYLVLKGLNAVLKQNEI